MILGLDIDGTISAAPAFYAFLARAWVSQGGAVHIVTARNINDAPITYQHLEEWGFVGIPYRLHMYPHPYNYADMDSLAEHFQAHAAWKADVCRDFRIDVLIDDDPRNLIAVREAGIYSLSAGFVIPPREEATA